MLVSVGRLRADLGLEVRGRLRRAAVHARAGPLHPAAARGRQADAAWSSSRSSAPRSATRSLGGSALAEARVGLAGPILGSLATAALLPIAARHRRRLLARARVHRASSSTSSTCCRSCRSTAAARWRRWRRGCGSSASARSSLLVFLWPNPILILIVLLGGLRDLPALEAAQGGRGGQRGRTTASSRAHRALVAAVYVGLIVLLALGMDADARRAHVRRRLIFAQIAGMRDSAPCDGRRRRPHRFRPDAEDEPQERGHRGERPAAERSWRFTALDPRAPQAALHRVDCLRRGLAPASPAV